MNVYKLINFLFLNDVGAHLKTHVEDLLIHTNFLPMKLGFMQELLPNQQRKKKMAKAHILEGLVQRPGSQRVSANVSQVYEAFHVWCET